MSRYNDQQFPVTEYHVTWNFTILVTRYNIRVDKYISLFQISYTGANKNIQNTISLTLLDMTDNDRRMKKYFLLIF